MFGEEYIMSYTDFSVQMGLVNVEYTRMTSYLELYVDLSSHLSPDQVWTWTLQGRETYICGTTKGMP